jgi:hypothetical protein
MVYVFHYICFKKKIKRMKIANFIMMAGAALTMVACGGESTPEEVQVDMTTMSVDTEASSLSWKGSKSPEYFHTGTVQFSEGSADFVDGAMTNGSFVIDLSTIATTDAELPDDKKAMLVGHLSSPDFFNVEENKTVKITTGTMTDGMLPTTISFMGQDIQQNVPVTVVKDDKGATAKGTFDVDFSALNIMGFQPQEGQTEHVLPVISFELNLKFK